MKIPLKIFFADPLRIQLETIQTAQYRAIFELHLNSITVTGENMSTTMQAGTLGTVTVTWKDSTGKPAKVDGATTWASSDPAIVKATVASGNPLICNLESFATVGDVSIQATADADLGEGMKTITSVLPITVIGGEAVGGDMTFTQGPAGPASPGGQSTAAKK